MRTKSVWEIDQIPPEKMQDNLLLLISDHEAQITYTIRLRDLKKYLFGNPKPVTTHTVSKGYDPIAVENMISKFKKLPGKKI